MTVGLVGSGPATEAVAAALSDTDTETTDTVVGNLGDFDLAVVAGDTGDSVFEQANERARATGTNWLAVELGGVGGVSIVEAAVTGFSPESGCYDCLRSRVNANLDPQDEPTTAQSAETARFAGAIAGRAAARQFTGDSALFGRIITVPFSEHEFLPLPNCCGGGRDRTVRHEFVDRELSESLACAERAVDDQFGIVQEVGEAESFPVPYYLARSCDTSAFSDVSAARDAAGVAHDWDGAFMRALGEALERYCAGIYQHSEFETGPPAAVENAVPPSSFVCETEPDSTGELKWVEGQDLATTERVMLPAEFVHYPPPSRRYRSPVTTGLGLGNSGTGAILSGLYEVIERDAMMLSWYSSFDPLALALDDDVFETLVRRAQSEGLDVTPLLLTQDVDVPVVAVAVQRDEWPQLALGSGAHLDVNRAARSALTEALQNWTELRGMGPEEANNAMGAIGQYASAPDTVADFVDADTAIPAESVGPDELPAGDDELTAVLDRLDEAELNAYAARTTTRDVEQLGFEAVRVVVPQAQPLAFGSMYFGDRAEDVPVDLGFEPALDRDHHPFP